MICCVFFVDKIKYNVMDNIDNKFGKLLFKNGIFKNGGNDVYMYYGLVSKFE